MISRALVLLLCASTLQAQVADFYRGEVTNAKGKSTLELSIYSRSDTVTAGFLKVGQPMDASGVAFVVLRKLSDSLFLASTSKGDTIVWASANRNGKIGGSYWVDTGPNAGQKGEWHLEPAARTSINLLYGVTLFSALVLVAGLLAIARPNGDRWWEWRLKQPIKGTGAELAKLRGIGGWLLWFVIGQTFLVLYQASQLPDIPDTFGGTWMLAAAVPSMRSLLVIESIWHVFQIVGVITGIVLILSKRKYAPVYWTGFLLLMMIYGGLDIVLGTPMLNAASSAMGIEGNKEMSVQASTAMTQNGRLIFYSLIWTLYWMQSRRVRFVFSGESAPAAVASPYSVPAPDASRPTEKKPT